MLLFIEVFESRHNLLLSVFSKISHADSNIGKLVPTVSAYQDRHAVENL